MKYPYYNRSLLSLASSVLTHYGVKTNHTTLPELDKLLTKEYKNVVIMLFDGMGAVSIEKHLSEDSFLRRHFVTTISSVFPSTTTAATKSIETGLSPIEHGWLGWSLYFDEIKKNVDLFPNTLSGTKGIPAADYHVAMKYLPLDEVFPEIEKRTKGEVLAYCVSPFSEFKSQSVNEICHTVQSLCEEDKRKYIYTYWPYPDYEMHEFGTLHAVIKEILMQINNEVEVMCETLADTLVIVTADHGLIDTQWRYLHDYPELVDCLIRMPSIEARAMNFFVKPEKRNEFKSLFQKYFGDCYHLFSKEQIYTEKLFGDGIPNSRSDSFIGDYIAVANGNISISCADSKEEEFIKAVHAGMTEDEMNIPFIVVRK